MLPATALRWSVSTFLFCVLPLSVLATAPPAPPGPDRSDPPPTVHETLIVTAHREATPPEAVGSSVTVITAEEIALRRQTTVAELLRTVAGVEVVRGGGPGQVTSVFIRGGSSSQTLVLIDNLRVNSATTGAFDFADLATDQIERIEIVRGPQSTLYGSEAVSGVISIFTRRGGAGGEMGRPRVRGLAEAGSDAHRRLRFGVEGGSERADYSVTLSELSTDGVSAALAGDEDDPHKSSAATARVGLDLGGAGRLDVLLRGFRGDVGIDGFDFASGLPADARQRVLERESLLGSLQWQRSFGGRVEQRLQVGLHDDDLEGRDPLDPFSNFVVESRTFEVTSETDVTLSDRDTLTLGVTVEEREGGSVGAFDERVDLVSFFVQNAVSWSDRVHLTTAVRHDDHSTFGGETTFRLASSVVAHPRLRLHGSLGTGFKAPTLNDLFFPFFSNTALRPETSRAVDLGVEVEIVPGVATLDVTGFDVEFDDLIAFDFSTFLPENLAEAESRGVEVTLDYRPSDAWRVSASYTRNATEDLATGAPLARRPKERGALTLFVQPGDKLRGALTLIHVAERFDSDGSAMDDYQRVDLALHYELGARWQPYVRLENLFDEEYEEVNGFTTPGMLAVAGLGWRF